MAGHSKWKNIQHRKGAQDARRGKVFTKIATEIAVATKVGGSEPESNPRLRQALLKARAANMPRDNIDRAIKKGSGDFGDTVFAEKVYEGYGPGGVAFVVECLTDNVNRTVGDVRFAFTKNGGNLGTEGSVSWMFQKKGLIVYDKSKIADFDKLFELAIEAGAEDVRDEESAYEIVCPVEQFNAVKEALDVLGAEPSVAEFSRIPENYTTVDSLKAESINKLVDVLEDNDDVQNVYHNAKLPDDEV